MYALYFYASLGETSSCRLCNTKAYQHICLINFKKQTQAFFLFLLRSLLFLYFFSLLIVTDFVLFCIFFTGWLFFSLLYSFASYIFFLLLLLFFIALLLLALRNIVNANDARKRMPTRIDNDGTKHKKMREQIIQKKKTTIHKRNSEK